MKEDAGDDFDIAMRDGDYDKAEQMINKLWLDSVIYITTKRNPELKELNYIKVKVEINDGHGEYLLSLLHISGDKLKLQELPNAPLATTS